MKTPSFRSVLAATAFGALTLSAAMAQAQGTAVTTTTTGGGAATTATTATTATNVQATTSEGTIQTFTPDASQIVVRTATGGPMTYTYTKRTTFVDAAGNVVNYESIRPGDATTVYYTSEGGQQVVTKVVVNRAAPAPVTKTTTSETTTTTTTAKH